MIPPDTLDHRDQEAVQFKEANDQKEIARRIAEITAQIADGVTDLQVKVPLGVHTDLPHAQLYHLAKKALANLGIEGNPGPHCVHDNRRGTICTPVVLEEILKLIAQLAPIVPSSDWKTTRQMSENIKLFRRIHRQTVAKTASALSSELRQFGKVYRENGKAESSLYFPPAVVQAVYQRHAPGMFHEPAPEGWVDTSELARRHNLSEDRLNLIISTTKEGLEDGDFQHGIHLTTDRKAARLFLSPRAVSALEYSIQRLEPPVGWQPLHIIAQERHITTVSCRVLFDDLLARIGRENNTGEYLFFNPRTNERSLYPYFSPNAISHLLEIVALEPPANYQKADIICARFPNFPPELFAQLSEELDQETEAGNGPKRFCQVTDKSDGWNVAQMYYPDDFAVKLCNMIETTFSKPNDQWRNFNELCTDLGINGAQLGEILGKIEDKKELAAARKNYPLGNREGESLICGFIDTDKIFKPYYSPALCNKIEEEAHKSLSKSVPALEHVPEEKVIKLNHPINNDRSPKPRRFFQTTAHAELAYCRLEIIPQKDPRYDPLIEANGATIAQPYVLVKNHGEPDEDEEPNYWIVDRGILEEYQD